MDKKCQQKQDSCRTPILQSGGNQLKFIRPEDDHFHDECGVVGVQHHPEASRLAYLALYALQHRGQESAGIVASDGAQLTRHVSMGLVADVFNKRTLGPLKGSLAIGHVRYSTAGDTTLRNAQPLLANTSHGMLS